VSEKFCDIPLDTGGELQVVSARSSKRDVGAPQPNAVGVRSNKTREIEKRSETNSLNAVCSDLVTLHWFWNETRNRLESLRHRVREGLDLQEAADFSRYVLYSGLLKILAPHDNQGQLKVDTAFLAWSATDLLREVQDLWQAGKVLPGANQPQYEAILHRLDLIAGRVAQIPVAGKSEAVPSPALLVLPGGAA